MNEMITIWSQWLKPSAGLPTVQWSILLALAAAAGHLVQRYLGLPKVLGYSVVGAFAGLAGFTGAVWPLEGIGLYLVELGVAVVLFEAGGRIPLRWFRHNPMVLVQSLLESFGTLALVFWVLRVLGVPVNVAEPLALVAMAASPAILMRVVMDTRAPGRDRERVLDPGGAGPVAAGRRDSGAGAALGAERDEPEQRKHLDPAARADRGRHRAGRAFRRVGAAGGAARRHLSQAVASAPVGLAAPVGDGLVPADHADVRAGVGRGGPGGLEQIGGHAGAGAGGGAAGRKVRRRRARQRRHGRELEAGALGRLRNVADVVHRAAAGGATGSGA